MPVSANPCEPIDIRHTNGQRRDFSCSVIRQRNDFTATLGKRDRTGNLQNPRQVTLEILNLRLNDFGVEIQKYGAVRIARFNPQALITEYRFSGCWQRQPFSQGTKVSARDALNIIKDIDNISDTAKWKPWRQIWQKLQIQRRQIELIKKVFRINPTLHQINMGHWQDQSRFFKPLYQTGIDVDLNTLKAGIQHFFHAHQTGKAHTSFTRNILRQSPFNAINLHTSKAGSRHQRQTQINIFDRKTNKIIRARVSDPRITTQVRRPQRHDFNVVIKGIQPNLTEYAGFHFHQLAGLALAERQRAFQVQKLCDRNLGVLNTGGNLNTTVVIKEHRAAQGGHFASLFSIGPLEIDPGQSIRLRGPGGAVQRHLYILEPCRKDWIQTDDAGLINLKSERIEAVLVVLVLAEREVHATGIDTDSTIRVTNPEIRVTDTHIGIDVSACHVDGVETLAIIKGIGSEDNVVFPAQAE